MSNPTTDLSRAVPKMAQSVEKLTHQVGKETGQLVSQFTDSATEYYSAGREYVQENPVKGVAIAAATGLVAGCLLTMVYSSKKH